MAAEITHLFTLYSVVVDVRFALLEYMPGYSGLKASDVPGRKIEKQQHLSSPLHTSRSKMDKPDNYKPFGVPRVLFILYSIISVTQMMICCPTGSPGINSVFFILRTKQHDDLCEHSSVVVQKRNSLVRI